MSVKYNIKSLNPTTHIYFNPKNKHLLEDIKLILENDNKFIMSKEDKKDNYKNLISYLYTIIENSEFLCKDLSIKYIKSAFYTADAIVVISSKDIDILPNGNIFGFASINFDEINNSIYIDILCSQIGVKYGGEILLHSINYMCEILSFSKIKLTSVSSAIPFYEKYGFYKRYECTPDENCDMEKIVKKLGGKKIKTLKSKRRNKKRYSIRHI